MCIKKNNTFKTDDYLLAKPIIKESKGFIYIFSRIYRIIYFVCYEQTHFVDLPGAKVIRYKIRPTIGIHE